MILNDLDMHLPSAVLLHHNPSQTHSENMWSSHIHLIFNVRACIRNLNVFGYHSQSRPVISAVKIKYDLKSQNKQNNVSQRLIITKNPSIGNKACLFWDNDHQHITPHVCSAKMMIWEESLFIRDTFSIIKHDSVRTEEMLSALQRREANRSVSPAEGPRCLTPSRSLIIKIRRAKAFLSSHHKTLQTLIISLDK